MGNRLLPPSATYWLGTDALGRDLLSRVIYGARLTLVSSLSVVVIGAGAGILFGSIAAYAGRWIDDAMMRITDLVLCFPPIILAMAIAASLGVGTTNTIIAMVVVWWPKFARLARGLVLVQAEQEYVDAARVAGLRSSRILLRHISPNMIGPLIAFMTVDLGTAIITFASLSFLGLGVVPPTAEWGAMVAEGREFIQQWWIATFPGIAILTVVIAFNFVGDGIRDWLDPRSSTL
jgi:peptide/nickel transport system permease protein